MRMPFVSAVILLIGSIISTESKSQDKHLEITCSPCQFVVTDPLGRKVGRDMLSGFEFQDGTGRYTNSDFSLDSDSIADEWGYWDNEPQDGIYEIDLFATESSRYQLSIALRVSWDSVGATDSGFEGLLEAGQMQRFHLLITTSPSAQLQVKKEVNSSTLRMPLQVGTIGNQDLTLLLLAKLDSAESAGRSGFFEIVNEKMQDFITELQAYQTSDSNELDHVRMMVSDAELLAQGWPRAGNLLLVPQQFSTIEAGVLAARPGDTVVVSAGKYDEVVKISQKDTVVVRAADNSQHAAVKGFQLSQTRGVTVKGFIVDASGTERAGITLLGSGNQNTDVTLEANEIKNAGKSARGILIEPGNGGTRIVNNRIHSNGGDGITVSLTGGDTLYVLNNTIVKNGTNGISVSGGQASYFVNNIVSFNGTRADVQGGRYGLFRAADGSPRTITLHNNLVVGNAGQVSSSSSPDFGNYSAMLDSTDSGNLTSLGSEGLGVSQAQGATFQRIFVSESPLNLHLARGSVALDGGVDWYSRPDVARGAIPEEDFEGERRPQGKAVDIGADELK